METSLFELVGDGRAVHAAWAVLDDRVAKVPERDASAGSFDEGEIEPTSGPRLLVPTGPARRT